MGWEWRKEKTQWLVLLDKGEEEGEKKVPVLCHLDKKGKGGEKSGWMEKEEEERRENRRRKKRSEGRGEKRR